MHELTRAVERVNTDRLVEARDTIARVNVILRLMGQQFRILDTLSPRAYFDVRGVLGQGSGQESPGFNAMLDAPAPLRDAFRAMLERQGVDLLGVHREPASNPEVFALAEALVDIDQSFQDFRYQHLALVRRIIGGRTPSLKGVPAEMLEHGVKQCWFPELWLVREALFRDFTPGPSLFEDGPDGAQ
jgi:tryptophan 2,3-dioxygenase